MKKLLTTMMLAAMFVAGSVQADLDQIKKAAEAGDSAAQVDLGILYQYGFNYQDNEVHALAWYSIAANQGNPRGVRLRDALRAKMTQKDIDAAQAIIGEYKPPAVPRAPAPVPAPAPAAMPDMSPPPAEVPAPAAAPAEMPPAQPEVMPLPAPEAK